MAERIGYEKSDGKIVYFCSTMPIFSHEDNDLASFRTITPAAKPPCSPLKCAKKFNCVSIKGQSISEIAKELGIAYDTLRKAVSDGRLKLPKKTPRNSSAKSGIGYSEKCTS